MSMAQDYDKIFKENIEEIILPLAEKLFDIHPERLEEIPDDLQITIERRPDFLKKVLHTDSNKDYILQLEFQKEDEPKMVFRMLEYHSLLLRKYELQVHQYVLFINDGQAKMATSLHYDNLNFRFQLVNLSDFDYRQFVSSDKPEEVILAILGNFGTDKPSIVITSILEKLKSLSIDTLRLEKCIKQLEVLSNLRKLQSEIIKQLEIMALTYDLKNDIRFQQGQLQGQEEKAIKTIHKMLSSNLPFELIAEYLEVSVDFVKRIADTAKK